MNYVKFECRIIEKFPAKYNNSYTFTTLTELPYTRRFNERLDDIIHKADTTKLFIGLLRSKDELDIGIKYQVEARYSQKAYICLKIDALINDHENKDLILSNVLTPKRRETILSIYPDFLERIHSNKPIDCNLIKGIKDKTLNTIRTKTNKLYWKLKLMSFLSAFNISEDSLKKIFFPITDMDEIRKEIISDPYQLIKIEGLLFNHIDPIVLKMFPLFIDSEERAMSFVYSYIKQKGITEGDTLILISEIINLARKIVPECITYVTEICHTDIINFKRYDNKIGLLSTYEQEKFIYERLKEIQNAKSVIKVDDFKKIDKLEDRLGFKLTDEQRQTIKAINDNNVVLLTGQAGTGKTQCILGILAVYHQSSIALCSLSAQAANRMYELTNTPAFTIHKLLGYGKYGYTKNMDNPLSYNIVVTDEASMDSIDVMKPLIEAIDLGSKIIIVGDPNQLAPIGAGNIYKDLLRSHFKTIKLTKIHRQAQSSGIIIDSNMIINSMCPIEDNEKGVIVHGENQDMFYIFHDQSEQILKAAIEIFFRGLLKYNLEDILIICPRKSGKISKTSFNNAVQYYLRREYKITSCIDNRFVNRYFQFVPCAMNKMYVVPGHQSRYKYLKIKDRYYCISEYDFKYVEIFKTTLTNKLGQLFYIGDRIRQRRNDRLGKKVHNGEIGFIRKIFDDDSFLVTFKDKEINYDWYEIEEIDLAYSMTTHLYQGNQNKVIIIAFDENSKMLLSNELLYTSKTRATNMCFLIGPRNMYKEAINKHENKRNTFLKQLIKEF